jgi:hypothetical protein
MKQRENTLFDEEQMHVASTRGDTAMRTNPLFAELEAICVEAEQRAEQVRKDPESADLPLDMLERIEAIYLNKMSREERDLNRDQILRFFASSNVITRAYLDKSKKQENS